MPLTEVFDLFYYFPNIVIIAEGDSEVFNIIENSNREIIKRKEGLLLQGDNFLIRVMRPNVKLVGLKFKRRRPLIILETDNYDLSWYHSILKRSSRNIIRWP